MKKLFFLVPFLLISAFAFSQSSGKTIKLEQTQGEFTEKELTLKAGKTYVFEVTNKGVDHPLGFVIAPAGKTEQEHHIADAYLSKMIADGETASSKPVTLEKGEYVYFCPLNPTPQYKIIVK